LWKRIFLLSNNFKKIVKPPLKATYPSPIYKTLFPIVEESPESLGGSWRKVKKMNPDGNGLLGEVKVHLFNVFIEKTNGIGHVNNGKRPVQFDLNSLHLNGVVELMIF